MESEKYNPWKEFAPTDRGLHKYLEMLNLTEKDITGKKILDLGSGLNNFARDIKQEDLPGTDVISFDLFYALSPEKRREISRYSAPEREEFEARRRELKWPESGERLIGGLAEELPFKNETFDMVVSVFAVPHYLESKKQIENFFSEVARVLKPGGEARFNPVWYRHNTGADSFGPFKKAEFMRDVLEGLKPQGIEIVPDDSRIILRKPSAAVTEHITSEE